MRGHGLPLQTFFTQLPWATKCVPIHGILRFARSRSSLNRLQGALEFASRNLYNRAHYLKGSGYKTDEPFVDFMVRE